MPKRQRHNSPLDIKKEKSAYEKEDKKSHCRCARKTGPIRKRFSANGPFRTAAILPF
jgi:hypothetical protein